MSCSSHVHVFLVSVPLPLHHVLIIDCFLCLSFSPSGTTFGDSCEEAAKAMKDATHVLFECFMGAKSTARLSARFSAPLVRASTMKDKKDKDDKD